MGERKGQGPSSPPTGGGKMKVDSFASSSKVKAEVEDPTMSVAVALIVGLLTVLLIFYLYSRKRRLGRGETGLGSGWW